tara:strand:+ start:25 stop:336 length:312 start_codon:yes stop_codon:yes gene_type:complete
MPRRKKIKKPSSHYYVFAIACIFFIAVLILNDSGLVTYFKLKKEHNILVKELQSLSLQQEALITEINRLQADSIYIEKIAREKFMMVRPGEKVFRVRESKTID